MIWATLNEMDEEVKIKPKNQHLRDMGKSDWALAADVYAKGKDVVVKINLAGVDPEKIDISITADSVKVSGTAEEEEIVDNEDYFMKEIRRGSFERTIKLPVRVEM
ncbi:MAG TPA: Hsp20/alpha crystallin family protein, partial [Candidatus Paceibacterota bacterium]|nr:Hsp20/alpha crystallin family protein [Candidatus Paceibacterota bacterium]